MCGTKKEFVDDTAGGPLLGSVGTSERVATVLTVPRRGGHAEPQGITANRAQAGQLEVQTSCQDKGHVSEQV